MHAVLSTYLYLSFNIAEEIEGDTLELITEDMLSKIGIKWVHWFHVLKLLSVLKLDIWNKINGLLILDH